MRKKVIAIMMLVAIAAQAQKRFVFMH